MSRSICICTDNVLTQNHNDDKDEYVLTQAQQPSFLPVRVSKVEFCVDHFEICLGWFSSLFSAVCFVFIHKN